MIAPPARRASLADLRDELRAAGLGKPAAVRTYLKFALLLAGFFGCLLAALSEPALTWWVRAPLAVLSAWFLTSAGMCGHDGAHGATSDRPWVNSLLASLGFTLLGGLAVSYWRHKHNLLHHPNVNVGKKDPDVEQGLLALSARQHSEHGRVVRWLQARFQGPAFWLLGAPLVYLDLKLTSLHFVLSRLVRGEKIGTHLLDLGWIVVHYSLWFALPLVWLPLSTTLAISGISTVVCGVMLTLIFAPAHIPYPVVSASHDPLLLQLASTRNYTSNAFFRWTLIGLDQQIEHHIAPKIPHFELPRAARIVRAYCARHGLPYHETTWLRAIGDTHVAVRDGWRLDEVVVGSPG